LALGLTLSLAVAACGGGDDDDGDTDTTSEEGGAPANVPGFDGTTIKLGVITPTSGPVAAIGNPLTAGNKAYFDYLNAEEGGIAGKYKVELDIRDSGYDPVKASSEYDSVKADTVMIAQLLGTPIVNAIKEKLIDDGVVASPASLDSFWVREPNLLPLGAPYQIQAINALDWYVTKGDGEGKKVCSLIQDDPYGEAGQEGLEFAAEELDIDLGPAARFPAPPAPADFTASIGQLQGEGCEMVFLVATASTTGAALGKAAQQGFAPQWIGQSPTWTAALGTSPLAPYLQANYLVVTEGATYGDTSVPGMAELVRIKDTYAPNQAPDIYFNFGYLQAKLVAQALEKAVELGDLSHDGILEAITELGTVSFDGLFGDYEYGEAEDRVPPTVNAIFKVDPTNPTGISLLDGGGGIEAEFAKDFEFTGE
jgi:ABC-type branched-subunit amino acid transport system substrate-binding protein